jgi:hypothetical protein
MKRLHLLGFAGLLASILAGCPIFSGDGNGGSGSCVGPQCGSGCTTSADCPQNETCGSDNQCHAGDCTFSGCPSGQHCVIDPTSQTASCQPGSSGSGGSGAGGSSTGGSTGTGGTTGTPVYCGHPADCNNAQICSLDGTCKPAPCSATNTCIFGYTCMADGTCQSSTPNACDSDAACMAGSVCIAGGDGKGGVCTPVANQCFDGSQCGPNEKCVSGKCTLGCTTNMDCRDGFNCDTTHGICTTPVKTCKITNDCGSSMQVCVGGACVPRSNGGTCPNPGDVWTENGCIPNQGATFTCVNDGMQDACAPGSICLHHDCWISCDPPNQNACANQPPGLNACKPVVDATKTYNVCGSAMNLGNQCGPGAPNMAMCTGANVCIDGFCK